MTESTPMTVHIDENETKGDAGNNLNNTTAVQQPNGRSVAVEELDGCVQFTSIVSASFMLVHCPNWMSCDLISLVDQMHKVRINFRFTIGKLSYSWSTCLGFTKWFW